MDDTTNKSADEVNETTQVTEAPVASEETSANPFAALKETDPEATESEEMKNEDAAEAALEEPEVAEPEVSESAASESDAEDAAPAEELAPAEEPATEEPKEEEKPTVPANPNARWYVVHTFAGHENKVATALRQRIEAEHLENLIYDILVPTQDKIEIKGGRKETVKEKIFPGYILIKMELSDLSWLAVRTTQGVTSFIGAANKPTPISEAEVASIVKFTTQGASPTFKDVFMVDDTVKIIDGPFAEFIGKVDSVDKEKGRVRVLVSIFGRETPVELDFLQVQKL